MSNRTSTVHSLEEWNAIIEHEVRSFAKALQAVKKQIQVKSREIPLKFLFPLFLLFKDIG